MATRGRKPKPSSQLKLNGTFRPDRHNADEPTPDVVVPKMPTFLKGEARKEWKRITPLLAAKKCITEWDMTLITAYCFEWGVYVMLCKKLKTEEDYIVTTINGNEIQSPLLNARNRAMKNFKEIATEFGLTPSSRTRLGVGGETKKDNPLEALRRQVG